MKTVLVTGGTGGIGEAICREFAKNGYFAGVGFCRSEAKANEIAKDIGGTGVYMDFENTETIFEAVNSFVKKYGRLDVVVNSAGIALPVKTILDVSEEEYDKVFSINVKGVFSVTKAAVPFMLERGGTIINISSMWGLAGGSCEAVYSASKAAVIGFTKAVAKEFAGAGIRVNAIAPGFIDTKMNAAFGEEDRKSILNDIPLARFGLPSDVAKAALYLADYADFVTGTVLNVSGGEII